MLVSVVITYDIEVDRARAKVSALLSMWGDRLERSVFELRIGEGDLVELLGKIGELIDVDRDAVHVFRQCARCSEHRQEYGQAMRLQDEPFWVV